MNGTQSFIILATVILTFVPGRSLAAQTVCPTVTDNPESRELVTALITDPGYAEQRQVAGLPALDVSHLRLLTDASDMAACRTIRERIVATEYLQSPWLVAFYTVDGYYFLPAVLGPLEKTAIRMENGALRGVIYPIPMAVFDREFRLVLDLMM
jgi:hypothetical protein